MRGKQTCVCFAALLIAAFATMPTKVKAQSAEYDFTGTATADNQFNSVNAQPTGGTFSTFTRVGVTFTSTANVFNSTGYDAAGTAINPAKYTSFSVTPTAGNISFFQSVNFQVLSSGSGPTNGQASVFGNTASAALASSTYTIPVSGSVVARSLVSNVITGEALNFRFYGYGGTLAGGTSRIDTVITTGATTNFQASSANLTLAAATQVYSDSTALGLSGNISGSGPLTKTGSNTVTLSGANSYTGATIISAGTLSADGTGSNQALGGTTSVAINNGGTLSLAADNQINSAATVTLGSSTGTGAANFSTGNHAQTVGALTLAASASITLGGGTSSLRFGGVNSFATGATLSISNYSGLVYQADGVTTSGTAGDTLFINGLNTTQLTQVQFVNPAGYTGTFGAFVNGSGEVFAQVPEPTTVLGGLLLMGAAGWTQRRRVRAVCLA